MKCWVFVLTWCIFIFIFTFFFFSVSFYLQVVPGSGVDDVTTARQMMSLTVLFVFFCIRIRGTGGWGPLQSGADPRIFYSIVIIYFSKDIWSQNKPTKKKPWHFYRNSGQQRAGNYLKFNFCTAFSARRQRSVNWLGTGRGFYSSAVCGCSPQWPCSITGLAVVVFIAFPPFVYSPVFS